jgi:hypothetical protein
VILVLIMSSIQVAAIPQNSQNNAINKKTNNGTEYWALIVGCNKFRYAPTATLPGTDRGVKDFKETLLASPLWHEDHIRILTGTEATKRNIINGLKWLAKMADEDDICVFFIASHGTLEKDIYPKDENDWTDTYLLPYDTYIKLPILGPCSFRFTMIRDDTFNRLFSDLKAKGLFAIFDTCYSGGFNDPPRNTTILPTLILNEDTKISAEQWMKHFGETVSGPGRVILMSCGRREIAQGLCFPYFAIEGMQGKCDANNDSICTGEEIFTYAAPKTASWLKIYKNWTQNPQIYDNYPGELPVTTANLPPTQPSVFNGTIIGANSQMYQYIIKASDPENEKIRYHINWDDNSAEVTDFYDSDLNVSVSHAWIKEGTYNVWVETEDDHHAMLRTGLLPYHQTVIMCSDNQVDQYQTKIYEPEGFYDDMIYNASGAVQCSQAQSFIPALPTLTKVDVWIGTCSLYNLVNNIPVSLTISIRSNLSGADLTSTSAVVPIINMSNGTFIGWTTFDFPDINVTPGQTYYIVCRQTHYDNESISAWLYGDPDYPGYPNPDEDPYSGGQAYWSDDGGVSWSPQLKYADDYCFVTYGR